MFPTISDLLVSAMTPRLRAPMTALILTAADYHAAITCGVNDQFQAWFQDVATNTDPSLCWWPQPGPPTIKIVAIRLDGELLELFLIVQRRGHLRTTTRGDAVIELLVSPNPMPPPPVLEFILTHARPQADDLDVYRTIFAADYLPIDPHSRRS